jgi:Ca-activated chloride channel family protein
MTRVRQNRAGGALTALLGTVLLAGGPPARGGDQIARFASRTDLVVLSAIAMDRHGRPVTDLRRNEFYVREDGRPQAIQHFSEGRELPARVLLLVDASGSMTTTPKASSPVMAARQLLYALDPTDQIALAGFDHHYFGVVAFTTDHAQILRGFSEVQPFGSTALHDALDHAAADLATHGEGRRAVVVVTDGIDNASQQSPEAVIARSRALDVPIYAISVVSPLDDPASPQFTGRSRPSAATIGSHILARYADMSGGAAFVVSDFTGLKRATDTIVGELKHQYRLGYDPPPGPTGFRRVQVTTTRKGVSVKTRSGYVPQS